MIGSVFKNRYIRQNIIIFIVYFFNSICNYIYQIYVGRALGPKEYGIFGALFAIIYVISVFSNTVQTGSAWAITKCIAETKGVHIGIIIQDIIKKTIYVGIIGLIVFSLISPIISKTLNIGSIKEVAIVGFVVFLSFPLPAALGIFQGLQRFNSLAVINILTFLPKLIFAILLVSLGYGVLGAISALSLGMIVAFLFSLFFLGPYLKAKKESYRYDFRELYRYSIPATIIMLCLAVPSNVDVIFSKYFFMEYDAGLYTAASVIGKIILFLPSSILIIMFPTATEMNILNKSTIKLLNISLICTTLLSGSASLILAIYPNIVETIFGYRYLEASTIIPTYAFMMFIFSLVWTIAYYCLALNNFRYTYIILLSTVTEICLIWIIHGSMLQIVWILIAGNLFLLITSYTFVLCSQRK